MVTTVFTRDSSMKLDLPEASHAHVLAAPPQEITVEVDKTDHLLVMGEPTDPGGLADKIKTFITPWPQGHHRAARR